MGRHFLFHDGGRAAAGYQGRAGDCVVRAVAIATGRPYQQVCDLVNRAALRERTGKRKRGVSNARTGVYKSSIHRVMEELGWEWTPTMQIGSGCTVHLRAAELPLGRLVVSVSKHLTAVIDGVIYDTHDCSRRGTRCVYGYWRDGSRARSLKRDALAKETVRRRPRIDSPPLRRQPPAERRVPRRDENQKRPRRRSFWEWLFA